MATATPGYVVVVVSDTDRLNKMAHAAVRKMGKKLRSVRAVKAQVGEFADKLADDPSPLRVEVFDVVGFCTPTKDRPHDLEPIVIHEGKPAPVSRTYLLGVGEYRVGKPDEIAKSQGDIVAALARQVAENVIWCEAMCVAIDEADSNCELTATSCDPRRRTVELYPDPDGRVSKRLPSCVKVEKPGPGQDAH